MPQSSRRDEKRRAIRDAAYRSFRDHGYHDTSVDMICEGAGVSKGSLYWHYDSKQEIFVDLLQTWAREIFDEVYDQFEATAHETDLATAVQGALLREAHRGRHLVPLWLELTVLARKEPVIKAALAKFYRRARTAIAEVMRPVTPGHTALQRRGLASAVFGGYTGVMMQSLVDREEADPDALLGGFMSVIAGWIAAGRNEAARPAATVIRPSEHGVTVIFTRGAELHDPNGLLEGEGEGERELHVAAGDAFPEGFDALLRQAESLQSN